MELTKSEQIRAGLQKSFQSGTSAKASTVRYGYKVSRAGELVIDPAEADTVLFIFQHFMNGYSLGKISDALAHMDIVSPSGRATWSRETISKLLANEKYIGDVVLGKARFFPQVREDVFEFHGSASFVVSAYHKTGQAVKQPSVAL